MSDRLVVTEEAVGRFLKGCYDGLGYLEVGDRFTDAAADSAGPNGRLAGALRSVADRWDIRRERLIADYTELLKNIQDARKNFSDLDQQLAGLLEGKVPSLPAPTEATPSSGAAPAPSPAPAAPPAAAAPATPSGPPSGAQPFVPPPLAETPAPPPLAEADPFAPREPTPSFPSTPNLSQPPTDSALTSDPLSHVLGFAQRWATLTGRPVEEVVALLVAGMGAAGLIPATLLATLGKPAPGAPGAGSGTPGRDVDAGLDSPAGSVPADPGTDGVPPTPSDPTGEGGDGVGSDGSGEGPTPADPGASGSEESSEPSPNSPTTEPVPTDPAAQSDPSLTPSSGEETASEVPQSVLDDLAPAAGGGGGGQPAAQAPLSLPPLEPAQAASASAGGQSAGLELPPLALPEPMATAAAAPPPLDLPDLTMPAVAAGAGVATATALPSLAVEPQPVAATPMAPMAAGLGGGGLRTGSISSTPGVTRDPEPQRSKPTRDSEESPPNAKEDTK